MRSNRMKSILTTNGRKGLIWVTASDVRVALGAALYLWTCCLHQISLHFSIEANAGIWLSIRRSKNSTGVHRPECWVLYSWIASKLMFTVGLGFGSRIVSRMWDRVGLLIPWIPLLLFHIVLYQLSVMWWRLLVVLAAEIFLLYEFLLRLVWLPFPSI